MRVRELMRQDVATARFDEGLDRAVQRMRRKDCGCLPVVAGDGTLVGMLTDRDVCLAALRTDRPLSRLLVREAMTPRIYTCGADESIADVERRMGQHQVRRLPVLDGRGALVGLISLDDVAREAWREEGLLAPDVDTAAVGRTLGEIGRPHLTAAGRPRAGGTPLPDVP